MKLLITLILGFSSKKQALYVWLSIWASMFIAGIPAVIKVRHTFDDSFIEIFIGTLFIWGVILTTLIMMFYYIIKAFGVDFNWIFNKIIDRGSN